MSRTNIRLQILWGSLQVTKSPSDQRIMLLAPDAADLETLFHRVKNAFIHRLEFNFLQENVHHLHYLRSKADNLHCRIGSLRIQGSAVEIDYDVVDFLGVHLKPQIYAISMLGQLREEYVTLFAHTAMRASVKHLAYEVGEALTRAVSCRVISAQQVLWHSPKICLLTEK